jgi:hypothetical protein
MPSDGDIGVSVFEFMPSALHSKQMDFNPVQLRGAVVVVVNHIKTFMVPMKEKKTDLI